MNGFVWNLLLALAWAAITGDFTPRNFVLGFALGMLILLFTGRILGATTYLGRLIKVLRLTIFFLRELVWSNLRIAYEVLTPRYNMRPGVVAVPLDLQSDAEITLLANLISLTPGTLSLDVSTDRRTLYIHAMYVDDPDQVRREIKNGFERRIREVFA